MVNKLINVLFELIQLVFWVRDGLWLEIQISSMFVTAGVDIIPKVITKAIEASFH